MLKYTLEFIAFLKENNAYNKFKKNCLKYRHVNNPTHAIELYDFLNPLVRYKKKGYTDLCSIINTSFVWRLTPEGFAFWGNLNEKWVEKFFLLQEKNQYFK